MAISSLVVRSGIGSWGDIAHLITRGLDIGAFVDVWTNDGPPATTWTSDTASPGVWTDISGPSTSWTNS
jgi:hypothetical protein